MNKKKENSILVDRLLKDSPTWWNAIKRDKEIYIEIRKDKYIDAYYNGGAVMKELKWSEKDGYQAKIHEKYMSDIGRDRYVECPLESLPERLSEIKERIRRFYSSDSEKGIQARLILNDKNYYIDSEYQDTMVNKQGKRKIIRFDLVRADFELKKIIIQELKRIEDSRLLKKGEAKNSRELNEIKEQLSLYSDFISNNKEYLLAYYKKLIETKGRLDLLSTSFKFRHVICKDFTIAEKPQLIISDYAKAYTEDSKKGSRVKAIIRNLEKENIDYSFVNINVDGYLYKKHLLSIERREWNSIFEMIPWIERIERIDSAETLTDHGGERTRSLKAVEYKTATVQLIARISKIFMPFDWSKWEEGIAILENQAFAGLNLQTTCKLLTILLYYKNSAQEMSPLGIPCMAHDLEDGRVLKLLRLLKKNIEDENNNP